MYCVYVARGSCCKESLSTLGDGHSRLPPLAGGRVVASTRQRARVRSAPAGARREILEDSGRGSRGTRGAPREHEPSPRNLPMLRSFLAVSLVSLASFAIAGCAAAEDP